MNPVRNANRAARAAQKVLRRWVVSVKRPSDSVEYSGIQCTVGETRSEEIFENSHTMIVRVRDYLIDVADWPFDTPPEVDDVITDTDGRFAVTNETADSAWRWMDRDREVYRIHTVEMERSDA